MKISVIVPTYNEKTVLATCIESLLSQSKKELEILIVDDGSNDGTANILQDFEKKYSNIHFFEQEHLGPGAARNLGAKKANGNILVFVDADMKFDKSFISNLVKPIEEGKAKGTFSSEEYVSNWENVWARCWNINENWIEKRRHPNNYPSEQPVFRAILKSEFDKVHGFTPGGYDDDWSLYKKLGYMAINSKNSIFYHKNPDNLFEVYLHAKWVGKRNYKYGLLGVYLGIVRASLPVSFVVGFWKSIVNLNFSFLIFKIVYDFGIFVGLLELIFKGNKSK